jgi:uncharacterized membrane protein
MESEMLHYYAAQGMVSLFVIFYFIPTIVAAIRDVKALGQVTVVNLFLGWTFIGWVVALTMAYREKKEKLNENRADK